MGCIGAAYVIMNFVRVMMLRLVSATRSFSPPCCFGWFRYAVTG